MTIYKGNKNISYKMLKDVGMTVPKVEKQVLYAAIQGDEGGIIICSKTGDEGSKTRDEGMQQ